MRKIFVIMLVVLLASCNNKTQTGAKLHAQDFGKFRNDFIDKLWQTYPGWASGVGYHKYDSLLVIPDSTERQKELAFVQWAESELKTFRFDSLQPNDKTDYRMVQNFIDGVRFNINEFKSYQWDPSAYNIGGGIFSTMDYKQMILDEKMRTMSAKLKNVPAYYEAARKNIYRPAKEQTELAVDQNKGSLYFFKSVFPDSLKASKLSDAEKAEFERNANAAQKAIEDYISWLQDTYLKKSDTTAMRSFRIGKELYAKKFKLDIDSRYTADEMYQKAEARKEFLHEDMNRLANELWPKYFPKTKAPADTLKKIRMMVDKISTQHCKRDEFMPTIEKQLPELVAFINAHHIIDLDSTKPLKVRKTPDYSAGVAGAGIDWPGPYDKDAPTYYNVTPLTNYTAADAESYLREYNNYVLQILNIHEAIPGHYTQGIYANRSPSMIKTIMGNGAMIEGWACYVERMMLEQGFNNSPEMWLFYDKWNLREACNFLLDYNLQCNKWNEAQAMDLMVNQAFQEEAEAKEKWKRATLSQVQLASYFTGLTEIYELREDMKKKLGDKFDLQKFHEQFLSYGSAPVKEIRALMLGN
ncbi:MAG TPA: DUF885 domain-containing protein [Chitinophagales bacterium]|nr:DUF885 domain-containing protein [Chitinophagales bacterium]